MLIERLFGLLLKAGRIANEHPFKRLKQAASVRTFTTLRESAGLPHAP